MPEFLLLPPQSFNALAGFIFALTFIFPAINLFILKLFGNISSLKLTDRKERLLPFVFIASIYVVTAALFYFRFPMFINLNKLLIIVAVMIVFSTVVTLYYKISIHSLAMAGIAGILLPLNKASETGALLLPTVIALALVGVVMSARLSLHAHTFREAWHGALAGLVIGFTGVILLF